jgi:hypothetical protein
MSKELPSNIEESPDWASDNKAKEEEENWSDEKKLTEQKNKNRIGFLKSVGWMAPAAMIMLSLVFMAFFVSWSWHFLATAPYQWLTPEQLSKIQSIIFSGAMGAIISLYLNKQID